jgi:hypothetical protein
MAKFRALKAGDVVTDGDGVTGVVTRTELQAVWGTELSGKPYLARLDQQLYVDWWHSGSEHVR